MSRRLITVVLLAVATAGSVGARAVSAESAAFTNHLACPNDELVSGADFTGSAIPAGETTVSNQATAALTGDPGGAITLSGVSGTQTAFWRLFEQTSASPFLAGTSVELSIGTFGDNYTATIELASAFTPQFTITDLDNDEFLTVAAFNGATPVAPLFEDATDVTEQLNGAVLELESIGSSLTDDLDDATTTTIWFTTPITRVQVSISNPNEQESGASIEITRFLRCATPQIPEDPTTTTLEPGSGVQLPPSGAGLRTWYLVLLASGLVITGTATVVRMRRTH